MLLSCLSTEKHSNDCENEYSDNLEYLKKYVNKKNEEVFSVEKIEKSILFLESKSNIKSEYGGDYVGKFRVTESDMKKWTLWLEENCDSGSQ